MTEVAKPHGRAEFMHLGIWSDIGSYLFIHYTEVPDLGQPDIQLRIAVAGRSSLYRVVHLGRMKAEDTGISI